MKRLPYASIKPLLKKISILSLYVMVGYLPFTGVLSFLGPVKDFLCILICICAIINKEYRFNWGTWCTLIYTCSVTIGAVLNTELGPVDILQSIKYRCLFAITLCLLFNAFRFTKTELQQIIKRILQILFISGIVVALIGMIELINPNLIYALYGDRLTSHLIVAFENSTATRLISTMSNPINLGLQMCLTITAGLFFISEKDKKITIRHRIITAIGMAISVLVLFYTYARTAYVVIVGVVLFFCLSQILFASNRKNKKMMTIILIGIVTTGFLFLLLNENIAARFGNMRLENLLANARFARAYNAFSSADNNIISILFGHGASRILGSSRQYVFEMGYASLLFESGILSLLLFGIPVVKSCLSTIRAIRNTQTSHVLILTYCCFVVVFCFAMITEDVYFQLPVVLYFWLGVFGINAQVDKEEYLMITKNNLLQFAKEQGLEVYSFIKRFIPDKLYLQLCFRRRMGKKLNLKNPQTFYEKLQWLKLYNRNPEYTVMVDKLAVKEYIAGRIGEDHIIPTLGVWDHFDEIDFDSLPEQFVLKCTHDSGGLVIVTDKKKINIPAAKKKIEASLKRNYYHAGREWPYKDVPRKIICEKYMTDSSDTSVFTDYKFLCFDGKVESVMVCMDRFTESPKYYFFDKDWTLQRINERGKNEPEGFTIPKPACIDEMFEVAARISKGFPFVRVDLYQSNGQIYFGELTFFPNSGFYVGTDSCGVDANLLPEADAYFGTLLHLPEIKR